MEISETYQQALEYLYSFVDYSLVRNFTYSEGQFDLSRICRLLERLGNPQEAYRILHVAGTKGKGSVSALCASALRAAGYRVGLYTSPHLHDFCERIQVDGLPIPHEDLAALLEEAKPAIEAIPRLTTFEITTALGFWYFARQAVDVAVVEVGLGGRLDATNVVDPLVSVITSLSYDHMAVLGDTLTRIAGEKAGIIKPGRAVVCAPQKEEALEAIRAAAAERHAPFTLLGSQVRYTAGTHSLDGQDLLVWGRDEQPQMDATLEGLPGTGWEPLRLSIPLLGFHQVENAVTAYAALITARSQGLEITDDDIRRGFAQVDWPGRFEVLRRSPPLVVDSAHNADSALKLRLALDDYFPGRPVVLIFGVYQDKDIQGIIGALLPRVRQVIATQAAHPRAMEAGQIVARIHQHGRPARAVLTAREALLAALEAAGEEAVVVAAGSLSLAAAVRQAWFSLQPDSQEVAELAGMGG